MTVPVVLADGGSTSGATGGNGSGGDDSSSQRSGAGDDSDTSTVEHAVIAVSVALTVALFAFVAWNAVAEPAGADLDVTVERVGTADDGRTLHEVRLASPGDRGLERATVIVECGDPPRELTFEHLPPRSERRATVACPAGAGDPPASVVSWTGS